MKTVPIAVTIAGSDSSGGAGIQADIKAMSANGVYAASILTALTAQNTSGVTAIHDVPVDFIKAQIDAVFCDLRVDAVKIGMLSQAETIVAVGEGLRKWQAKNIVLDPVMVAESGDPLIAGGAVDCLVSHLFQLCSLITPNRHEAARITETELAGDDDAVLTQANKISKIAGGKPVLLKGGHGHGKYARDLLVHDGQTKWFEAPRIETVNTHGTGCSLSSAVAANLAKGMDLETAVGSAKQWLSGAIANADSLKVGGGPGPIHHFYELWRESK